MGRSKLQVYSKNRILRATQASKRMAFTLVLLWAGSSHAAEPIFWSDTETELKHPIAAPTGLIQFVLRGEDAGDKLLVDECMREQNLKKGDEAKLFAVAEVSLGGDARKAYFVRPALKPYCFAFYGAHLFRYWFVVSTKGDEYAAYQLLFKSGGDGVGVLPTSTNGYGDLLLYNHSARTQFWVTLAFNGREYQEASCERKDFQTDGSLQSAACHGK